MPDVTDRVKPLKPPAIHVYVYVEGGNVQATAASVPVVLHIADKDNHEGISIEDKISALFAEHKLDCEKVTEDWITVPDPGLDDHLDTTVEEEIPEED